MTKAKEGVTIPDALPSSLLPFKIRHSSISNGNGLVGVHGGLVGGINSAVTSIMPTIANEIKVRKEFLFDFHFLTKDF